MTEVVLIVVVGIVGKLAMPSDEASLGGRGGPPESDIEVGDAADERLFGDVILNRLKSFLT
jgi:hypothetical protein